MADGANAPFSELIVSDSIPLLQIDQRIQNLLRTLDSSLQIQHTELDSIHVKLSQTGLRTSEKKSIKSQESLLEKSFKRNIQIKNYLLSELSFIRKVQFKQDRNSAQRLQALQNNLTTILENKSYKVPAVLHASTELYDAEPLHEVYSDNVINPCNLNENVQSGLVANTFELLFEMTDDRLANYYKEDEFLSCYARFITSKTNIFLELKFVINSPKASKIFGGMDAQNPSRLDFMNGEFVYLNVFALSDPSIDQAKGQTIYHVQYKLDKEDIGRIRKNTLDYLTILWTAGAERYEIYNIDLLKNLFACIQNKN